MSQHTITLIPGDGIGPEVTDATVRILEAAGKQTGTSFAWGALRCRRRSL